MVALRRWRAPPRSDGSSVQYIVAPAVLGAVFRIVTAPLKAITTALAGGFLMYALFTRGLYMWMVAAGVAFAIFGLVCGTVASRKHSPAWAFNGLTAFILAVALIGTGLVQHVCARCRWW